MRLKSPIHEDFSYSSFSEGEKMRIDLALVHMERGCKSQELSKYQSPNYG